MLFDRFRPILAIVGSSNFTVPGLTSNRELNLAHKVLLDLTEVEDRDAARAVSWLADSKPSERITLENRQLLKSEVGARAIIDLERWYEAQWADARDFKQDLIELLDASKFGQKEYTPYQVYIKALYEYFKEDLGGEVQVAARSAVELAEFQEDAVKKARKILARYEGVIIADSVGLGKTWIGKKLLEDFAYHMRQKALVICPASLRTMWEAELRDAAIAAEILSQEELGQANFKRDELGDVDVIVIDESHNFRNKAAQRYENLERLISLNGGRGRDGGRKRIILLTATPIHNDLLDLYQQINLITRNDRGYFATVGIGDLHRYFVNARREYRAGEAAAGLFNLLEELVIRRTRGFIRKAYPNATIRGELVAFPERKLRTVKYDLEGTYAGIYDQIVSGIEDLQLAPYNLEAYKKAGVERDEFEQGRQEALVGIFKSRYLKRFESSVAAFRISVRRALQFQKTFQSYIVEGKVLASADFQRALRFLEREDEDDDATPSSLAEEFDADEDVKAYLDSLPTVDFAQYDRRRLIEALQHDIDLLTTTWHQVKDITRQRDAKLQSLKDLLAGELRGKKVLIFSHYRDTARYLYRELGGDAGKEFRDSIGNPLIRRMDSGADPQERNRIVQSFAPVANRRPDLVGSKQQIDMLISTDVLSEGQNLQDCGHLINYDLHWNPMRMVQRAGRIDRLGTQFKTLWIYNMFPDLGLERLLGLLERLTQRIHDINQTGFLDASILGETVNPRNFNTLRRIRDEDGSVIEEEEQFSELASSEFLFQQLRTLLEGGGKDMLESLPDGIHSGLIKEGARGVFFYFQAPGAPGEGALHFWKYYDLRENQIVDNRYRVANLIACHPDTPRVIGAYDLFSIQEKVIQNILESQRERRALESVPRPLDPIQQTAAAIIQAAIDHPGISRAKALEAIRFLNQPLPGVHVREIRSLFRSFQTTNEITSLVDGIVTLQQRYGGVDQNRPSGSTRELRREDLRLICFDYLCS